MLDFTNEQPPFKVVEPRLPEPEFTYVRFDFWNRGRQDCNYGMASRAIGGLKMWVRARQLFDLTLIRVIVEGKVLAIMGFAVKPGDLE